MYTETKQKHRNQFCHFQRCIKTRMVSNDNVADVLSFLLFFSMQLIIESYETTKIISALSDHTK